MVACGAKPGVTVCALLEHRWECVAAQLAAGMAGAAFFAMQPHLGAQTLAEHLALTKPKCLLTSARMRAKLEAAVEAAVEAAAITASPAVEASPAPLLSVDAADWSAEAARLGAAAIDAQPGWARAAPFEPAIVTMTSGTSGKPKVRFGSLAIPLHARVLMLRALPASLRYPHASSRARIPAKVLLRGGDTQPRPCRTFSCLS